VLTLFNITAIFLTVPVKHVCHSIYYLTMHNDDCSDHRPFSEHETVCCSNCYMI